MRHASPAQFARLSQQHLSFTVSRYICIFRYRISSTSRFSAFLLAHATHFSRIMMQNKKYIFHNRFACFAFASTFARFSNFIALAFQPLAFFMMQTLQKKNHIFRNFSFCASLSNFTHLCTLIHFSAHMLLLHTFLSHNKSNP